MDCQLFCSQYYGENCTWWMFDETINYCKIFKGPQEELYDDCFELGFASYPFISECQSALDSFNNDQCHVNFRFSYLTLRLCLIFFTVGSLQNRFIDDFDDNNDATSWCGWNSRGHNCGGYGHPEKECPSGKSCNTCPKNLPTPGLSFDFSFLVFSSHMCKRNASIRNFRRAKSS